MILCPFFRLSSENIEIVENFCAQLTFVVFSSCQIDVRGLKTVKYFLSLGRVYLQQIQKLLIVFFLHKKSKIFLGLSLALIQAPQFGYSFRRWLFQNHLRQHRPHRPHHHLRNFHFDFVHFLADIELKNGIQIIKDENE